MHVQSNNLTRCKILANRSDMNIYRVGRRFGTLIAKYYATPIPKNGMQTHCLLLGK